MSSSNAILSANGGLHSRRAMKKVKERLQNHGMKRAILVQFVLTGSQSVQVYRDTYNDIADHIRDNGSRCEYFGCLEMDESKGLHAHIYFVIETSKKFPYSTLDVRDGAWLHKLAERRGLVNDDGSTRRIHIAQPQNKMHYAKGKPQFFARLDEEAKLADCLERIEYLYKNRSKEGVPSREIYFNSNFEANKAKRVAAKAKLTTRKAKPVPAFIPEQETPLPAAPEATIPLESGKVFSDKAIEKSAAPAEFKSKEIKTSAAGQATSASKQSSSVDTEKVSTDTPVAQPIRIARVTPLPSYRFPIWETEQSEAIAAESHQKPVEGDSEPLQWVGIKITPEPLLSALRASQMQHEQKGNEMKLTPAQNYLSTLYERCIDSEMHLDAIRLYLLEQGIRKTPAQLVDDLDNVFCFTGYAESHPAPAKPNQAMLDALIDRTPLKAKARVLGNSAPRFRGTYSDPVAQFGT